jgi:hypothetical protein
LTGSGHGRVSRFFLLTPPLTMTRPDSA